MAAGPWRLGRKQRVRIENQPQGQRQVQLPCSLDEMFELSGCWSIGGEFLKKQLAFCACYSDKGAHAFRGALRELMYGPSMPSASGYTFVSRKMWGGIWKR